ncbi:hypothetical protein ACJ41O_011124 [Fusarium nematophilum]
MAATRMSTSSKDLKASELEKIHDEKMMGQDEPRVPQGDYSGAAAKTDPAEIALVRKLDRMIMPILWAMYFLNYLDRNALPQARLNTLEEDLNLKGVQYNTAISILFVGYLLMQVPSNMFMTRTRPSIYLSCCMIGWAAVSACTATVHSYSGLVACRFFLGFVEAPFYPGALYLLSIYYTRKELATRISLLLFIIEGSVTALVAVFGFFLLPDDPSQTRWLTPEERELCIKRISRDTVGQQTRGSTWEGLKQACKDPRTWLFCLMQNLHISACSFNNFFPTIIRAMGFKSTTALLLTAPPYFVSGFLGIPFAWSSGHFNERTWHITAGLSLAVVGFVISCATVDVAARYTATFLYATGAYSVGSVILGWVSNTLSQTPEKKSVAYALVNVTANLAYIYCAYLWPSKDDPKYLMGFSSMVAFAATSIMCAWGMRVWLKRLNRQIRESEDEGVALFYEAEGIEQRRQTPPQPQTITTSPQHLQETSTTPLPSRPITLQPATPGLSLAMVPDNTQLTSSTTMPGTGKQATEPVIGHMGRLVADDRQASMFGGSTTGVHFISQAEQQLQLLQMHKDAFPSCAYGLYLHSPWGASVQNASSRVIPEIIRQLPPSAVDIVEATINRWTPLYPIVHKPSTMDALQRLLAGYETSTSDIVILYQALGLLALGTIGQAGDCMRQHHHFLCVSERFYLIAATLLDRVIDQPCLQSLQGLVIMQIYLQLSGRYSTASHISGVATRLAQTLGLHRHSHRFKFDPLETELRRRAWWCQYSLDAFSSAYHGMPRLIRDQDVDTDFPTSVDHDLLSRTHVEFPLPGERSQVDTAISLFKLARIIARTLEDLYTTTRRRGGVAKIAHLQAELDMWERAVLEPETGTASMSLESTFLRVSHCVATIHIHRPALSFTTADPQFVLSLKACSNASATLIGLLSTGLVVLGTDPAMRSPAAADFPGGDWPVSLLVTLLYPNGIHMLWQAGLTILFAGWKGYPVTVDQDESLIQSCIETLRRLHAHVDDVGGHVSQCADVLDLLRKKIFSDFQVPPDLDQLQWNVWDWPMASALELANTLDTVPLDVHLDPERWL